MTYSVSFQLKGLPKCHMSKFEVQKNGVTPVLIKSDLLNEISLEPKMSDVFSKLKL